MSESRLCICADPENCREVPEGYICRREASQPELLGVRKKRVLGLLGDFYTEGLAERFLYERQQLLGNERPMELMRTESGYAKVVSVIQKLRDGVYL